ncbi:MAG: laminin G domain-containing protein [Phycisphaerales bacterium]|nr:laminin G domain-containing protein [Phycisphaerales bacterium]
MFRFMIAFAVALAIAGGAIADIQSGMIAYWDFEDGTAIGWDTSGNGHHGSVFGTVVSSSDTCPFPGSQFAAEFGDLAGHIRIPDHVDLDPAGDFTLAAWVKNRRSTNYNGSDTILAKHAGGANQDGSWIWAVEPYATPHNPTQLGHYFISTPWSGELVANGRFPLDGAWHHMAMVYEDTADRYTFYIDGVAQSGAYVANIADNPRDLYIGGLEPINDYAGLLDEIRMYSRALSASDVRELIEGPCIPAFADEFAGALDAWQSIGNGAWVLQNGLARQTFGPADDGLSVLKLSNESWGDLDFIARWRQDDGPQISSGISMLFRVSDEPGPGADVAGIGPHYQLGWARTAAAYGHPDMWLTYADGYRNDGGDFRPVGAVDLASITLNQSGNWFGLGDWRRTRVRALGTRIQVFVDHDSGNPAADTDNDFELVMDVVDTRRADGRIALNDHFATTSWDYVRVRRVLRGDMNCDCVVNNFDVDPFVLAITNPQAYETTYAGCAVAQGDMNLDGAVDNFDIDAFVDCLAGNCP